ncbi:hypothetical protein ACQKWADRAFT_220792 [Trichoderma austrokoningii]
MLDAVCEWALFCSFISSMPPRKPLQGQKGKAVIAGARCSISTVLQLPTCRRAARNQHTGDYRGGPESNIATMLRTKAPTRHGRAGWGKGSEGCKKCLWLFSPQGLYQREDRIARQTIEQWAGVRSQKAGPSGQYENHLSRPSASLQSRAEDQGKGPLRCRSVAALLDDAVKLYDAMDDERQSCSIHRTTLLQPHAPLRQTLP